MTSVLDRPLRGAILAAADNSLMRKAVSRYGMRLGAKRFVACGILGEGVRGSEEAIAAADQYCALLHTFAEQGIDANVAFKLTHVGLDIDPKLAFDNAVRIAQAAHDTANTMRLDMEQSTYVDATLSIYRRLRERFTCVGFALQSYLFRSRDDLHAALPLGPNIRFVKGAYLEPPAIAYAKKQDVDENYARLVDTALSGEGYTAIATHDPRIIARVEALVAERNLPKRGRYEFQMLYGIGTPLAETLVERGYRVRLAIPFGNYWFPYLMRRLAERPANLAFFLKEALSRG